MSDRVNLEVGMLVLGNVRGTELDTLLTVSAVSKARRPKATLICHLRTFSVEVVLKDATLPEGWRLIDNRDLARKLARPPESPEHRGTGRAAA
jgi:hypothetical protein